LSPGVVLVKLNVVLCQMPFSGTFLIGVQSLVKSTHDEKLSPFIGELEMSGGNAINLV
jgi:hypothetical protein